MKKLSFVFVICSLLCIQLTKLSAQITFVNAHTLNITPPSDVSTTSSTTKWFHRFGVSTGTLDGNYIEWQKSNGKAPDISMVVPGILNSAKAYNIYLYYVSPSTQNWWVMAKLEDESNYTTYNRSSSGAIQINDNNGDLTHNRLYRVKIGIVTGKTDLRVDFTDGFTAGDNVVRIVFDGVGYEEVIPTIFRSKASGNWNNANTWQASHNSSTWFDATTAPSASATSVSVLNGHAVAVTENATIAGSLAVNSGGQLTLNSGATLGITGNLSINSDAANGTGTLVDANPNGGLAVSGTTNVYQYVSSSQTGVNGRNWYISSPLSAATSSTITTATGNGLVWYDGTSNWPAAGTTMEVMKGYIAKSPTQNTTINFTGGNLNTGSLSLSDLPLGFNLVGNPYVSYVNWATATKSNVSGSIWYRSKKTGSYQFHTYNVIGGVGVNDGTEIIPPMQSFWVKTTNATNSLGFSNAMRSHQDQSVMSNRLKASRINKQQLVRLRLSNAANSDEAVVYFNANAQSAVDEYDSQKMFNNIDAVPEIYSKVGADKLVINAYGEVSDNLEVPIGFTYKLGGDLILKLAELSNFDSNTKVYLHDKQLNSQIELSPETEYAFNTPSASNNESRFSLIFRASGNITGIEIKDKSSAQVFVNTQNQITIMAADNSNYAIYSAMGQLIDIGVLDTNHKTQNTKYGAGVYFVQLELNGQKEIHKVVIR